MSHRFQYATYAPSAARAALAALSIALAACATDERTSDSAAAETSAGTAAMPGHDMNRPAAKDADHEFLRMMADHHEGLIEMATAAMTKATKSETQGEAHQLHTKQEAEQKQMLAKVQTDYGETVTPMVLPSNKTMIDDLSGKTGADYDRAFYRNVVAHHREGIRMIDDILPRLGKPEVKEMAAKMKADQEKEIQKFEPKAGA